ncbi:TetR family transcriptional regulator [Mycobacteroides abscessus subsp. abscessus]|nr:TetR family transcriptional regulator [Mycobacteroides abscessus subsp. abscessus]
MVADEPEIATGCTTALLSNTDEAVRAVRDKIGLEIHRRIRSAMGPDADPRVVSALEMTFFGALMHAGSGTFTYHQIASTFQRQWGLNGQGVLRATRQTGDVVPCHGRPRAPSAAHAGIKRLYPQENP